MPEIQQVLLSSDGSHTLSSTHFNETYHSTHGALTESQVVFIDAGLNFIIKQNLQHIRIFEMGFGTGLNALLAYDWGLKNNIPIYYHTVEAYPIQKETYEKLNYGKLLGAQDKFIALHQTAWDESVDISKQFTFIKCHTYIENYTTDVNFDIIFYDAFAPATQPHLWGVQMMGKMHDMLNEGGVLVTYCAQGAFKRHLKAVGFNIEALPGPPGKRQITRAEKPYQILTKL